METTQTEPELKASFTPTELDQIFSETAGTLGRLYTQSLSLRVLTRMTAIKAVSIGNWHPDDWEDIDSPEYIDTIPRFPFKSTEEQSVEDQDRLLGRSTTPFPTYTFSMLQISWPMTQNIWFDYIRQDEFGLMFTTLTDAYVDNDHAFRTQLDTNDNIAMAVCIMHYHRMSQGFLRLPETVVECAEFWYENWIQMQETTLRSTMPQKRDTPAISEERAVHDARRRGLAVTRALTLYARLFKAMEGISWGNDEPYLNIGPHEEA